MKKRSRPTDKQVMIEDVIEPHPHNLRSPSVAMAFSEVAAEWHKPKNCGFTPNWYSQPITSTSWQASGVIASRV